MRKLLISSLLLVVFNADINASSSPSGFSVDGDLSDWGISKNGNVTDWTPAMGISYIVEDQHPEWGQPLEPGYGGQKYDAEALYTSRDETSLFVALATGHNPETINNPSGNSFGAGDFAIDFGQDGSYEVGINIKPNWDGFGIVAGVYSVTEWAYGLWADDTTPGYVNKEHPTSIVRGDLLGTASLSISGPQSGFGEWGNDDHFFYEMGLNLDLLTAAGWQGDNFNVHWTQNCGNDSIMVESSTTVPTPGTLMLLIAGFIGLKMTKKNGGNLLIV